MSCRKRQTRTHTHIYTGRDTDTNAHIYTRHSCGLGQRKVLSCNLKQFRPRVVKEMRPNSFSLFREKDGTPKESCV